MKGNLIKLSIILLLLTFSLGSTSFSQQQPPPKKTPLGNVAADNIPVQIEAKKLTVYQQESKVIFEGNVVLKRGATVIHCDKLTAYYDDKTWEVKTAICKGSVKVTHKDTIARCDEAIFDNEKQTITMKGNPVVYQGENIFRGDELKYYMSSEKITGTNVRFQRNPKPTPRPPKTEP